MNAKELREHRKRQEAAAAQQEAIAATMPSPLETTHRDCGYDVQDAEAPPGAKVLILVDKGLPAHIHAFPLSPEAVADIHAKTAPPTPPSAVEVPENAGAIGAALKKGVIVER